MVWQLRPATTERLREVTDLLLGAGADPSALDAAAAQGGATLLAAVAEDDASDDEELHADNEAALPAAEATALSNARRSWCLRRLGNRLETVNMCQSPLRCCGWGCW